MGGALHEIICLAIKICLKRVYELDYMDDLTCHTSDIK